MERDLDSLGGSIAYEECKGDYAKARRLAESWLTEARKNSNDDTLADALIGRSIVHLLQGEAADAAARLDEASRLTTDPDRRLLVASYRWLAELEQFNTGRFRRRLVAARRLRGSARRPRRWS